MSPDTLVQSAVSITAPMTVAAPTFDAAEFDAHVMGTYGRFPLALERGAGCRVWDTEGREYLDFVAGIATCTLGHAHPAIVAAVTDQIQKLHHVSNLYYNPLQGHLAKWLTEHSCADSVFFCNSGAEANESAIKLVRKYATTKLNISNPVIITAQSSFHGRTLAAVTATGQPKYHKGFEPMVQGFVYVPYNDIAAMEATIAEVDADGRRVAAILMEPLQGEGGVHPGQVAYFRRLREICDEFGILLILDEVQVGMGRTGKMWGYENLGIEPDAFTLAKGLGGGIPIGALLCKSSCDIFKPGEHASTFGGNPFACRVGLAICEVIEQPEFLINVKDRGEQLRQGLEAIAAKYPKQLSGARGWGLIQGLALQDDLGIGAIEIVKTALNEGLLLVPAGVHVVRYVPPLNVTAAEIDEALAITDRSLQRMFG